MGLDQYLSAKVYVPKMGRPDDKISDPMPLAGGLLTAISFEPGKNEPILNPRFGEIITAVGFDPLEDKALLSDTYGAEVTVTVAYWRKQNQIHGWFEREHTVENNDEVRIERSELIQLRDACVLGLKAITLGPEETKQGTWGPYTERKVLAYDLDALRELGLAPTEGFFFGGTEIDDYYVDGLETTVAMLTRVLEHPALTEAEFTYRGWW